jgi:hypothetical protein
MKNTALFALSSPEGGQNYFSKLINAKIDGKPLFRVCDCQLICEACQQLEREKQILCNHVKQTPPWLSKKKTGKFMALTDPATALKEYGGIIADDFVPCFEKLLLQRMFSNPHIPTNSSPQYVFITVDPSGGGTSQLAICSGYYDFNLNYVVSKTKNLLCAPIL